MSYATYQFPSLKAAEKLPAIELEGHDLPDKYRGWLSEHPEITTQVPPVYRDFTIRYTQDWNGRIDHYVDIVHYSEDMTQYDACHAIEGKKIFELHADYAEYAGEDMPLHMTAPETTRYSREWLIAEGKATGHLIAAVQAYILYHRPEVIPVYLTDPPQRRKSSASKPVPKSGTKTVAKTVRRYIRLTGEDPLPREINYRKIQWTVRGHYRRLPQKDGSEKLTFVRPHTAKRGERKTPAGTLKIKE